MSLQIWLPLNGDIHNQGLNQVIPNLNGATLDNTGKIGKCYSFSGSNSISLPSVILPSQTPAWSFSAWIYLANISTTTATCLMSERTATASTGYTIFIYPNTSRILVDDGKRWDITLTNKFAAATWYHFCVTRTSSSKKLYINGTLVNTSSSSVVGNTSAINSNGMLIGLAQKSSALTTGDQGWKGKLNDIRIYDHCLSAKEVEEIAKGLVLHYKLSETIINPNILTGTYYNSYGSNLAANTTATNALGRWAGGSGGNGTFSVVADATAPIGGYSWNITNNTTGNRDFQQGDQPYITNQVYTASFWAKGSGTCLYRSWNSTDGKAMFTKQWTLTTNWKYYTYTFTASAEMETDRCTFHLGVTGQSSISISGMKMELGGVATPWSPAVTDAIYENNNTIIYDCCGYQNNGTINGTLSTAAHSSRYDTSTHFNGTDNCIQVPYNTICPENIFTINLWFYKDALGSKSYETLFGGPSGFEMDARSGSASTLSLYMASTRGGNVFSPLSFNQWNMITMVRDGINEFYYVNGELKKTIEAKSMPTGTYRIGAWNGNEKQNFYGEISDFRIYSTCLSAAAIKELYDTSASVDASGNIYARELKEV